MLLNNQWITEEIKEEIKKHPQTKWQWKRNNPKPMVHSKSSSKSEVHRNTILPREMRKISNNLSLHLKQWEKDKQNPKLAKGKKPWRAEINETGTKNTLAKINETKSWFFEKIKLIRLLARLIKKKGREFKSIKLEWKKL